MRKGSTSLGACEVRCWCWLFGNRILISFSPGRAAAALAQTLVPFCLPWDMEIEYHFRVHNTSVFFATPSLIVQGSFLNPGESGFTGSSLLGERDPFYTPPLPTPPAPTDGGEDGAAEVRGAAGGGGGECEGFSFFDCHSTHDWDECVRLKDLCGEVSTTDAWEAHQTKLYGPR